MRALSNHYRYAISSLLPLFLAGLLSSCGGGENSQTAEINYEPANKDIESLYANMEATLDALPDLESDTLDGLWMLYGLKFESASNILNMIGYPTEEENSLQATKYYQGLVRISDVGGSLTLSRPECGRSLNDVFPMTAEVLGDGFVTPFFSNFILDNTTSVFSKVPFLNWSILSSNKIVSEPYHFVFSDSIPEVLESFFGVFDAELTTYYTLQKVRKEDSLPIGEMTVDGEKVLVDCAEYSISSEYYEIYGDNSEEPTESWQTYREEARFVSENGDVLSQYFNMNQAKLFGGTPGKPSMKFESETLGDYLSTDFNLSTENGIQYQGGFTDNDNQVSFDIDPTKTFE